MALLSVIFTFFQILFGQGSQEAEFCAIRSAKQWRLENPHKDDLWGMVICIAGSSFREGSLVYQDTGTELMPQDIKYYQEFGGQKVIFEKKETAEMKKLTEKGQYHMHVL